MCFLWERSFILKVVVLLLTVNKSCQQTFSRDLFDQSHPLDFQGRPLAEATTWCQYRDVPARYNSDVFRLQSSFGCYSYTAPSRFNSEVGRYNYSVASKDGMKYQLVIIDGVQHNVDYMDPDSVELISKSFKSTYDTYKWRQCSEAAGKCCDYMLSHLNIEGFCPATWDGWYCWRGVPNNMVQYGICPDYIYSGTAPECHHESSKQCFPNGVWNATTSYVGCDITPRLRARTMYHVIMLSISLVVSVPAIIIFLSYRKLRASMRVILNRNLLIAIVIRNILTIISKTTIILDAITVKNEADSVMVQNGVGCKILTVLEKLATNAVFACMLLLGIYLHRLIAASFRGEPRMLYYFVAVGAVSCVPVIAWSIVTATLNDKYCWTVDNGGYQWINDSIKLTILAINMVLIADIIRVLVTKLGKVNTKNSNNIRRTTKATILLVPVFGVQFVFTAARPDTVNCTAEQVFYYFSYGLDGIQGAVVSLLFCYLNNEVRALLCKTMTRAKNAVRMRLDENYVADAQNDPRRSTVSTSLGVTLKDTSALPAAINKESGTAHMESTFAREESRPEIGHTRNSPGSGIFTMEDIETSFFTPTNSLAGSPTSPQAFFTPRSSFTGSSLDVNFYDCIDDTEPITNLHDAKIGNDSIFFNSYKSRKPIVGKSQHEDELISPRERFNSCIDESLGTHQKINNGSNTKPENTSGHIQYFDNRAISLSTENLQDEKSNLRKRNPSFEKNNVDSEV